MTLIWCATMAAWRLGEGQRIGALESEMFSDKPYFRTFAYFSILLKPIQR